VYVGYTISLELFALLLPAVVCGAVCALFVHPVRAVGGVNSRFERRRS
jgi:hypothetical protein